MCRSILVAWLILAFYCPSIAGVQPPAGMALVPAGEFTMGSNLVADEQPPHTVNLEDFFIDIYEVTNAQYQKFIDATHYTPPPHWRNRAYPKGEDNLPVVNVSWYDAVAYCEWAGKRLPTEEQWEKAARGADQRIFPWGNEPPTPERCNNNRSHLLPVGGRPQGASPYGCEDMAGNAWEWTASWYQPYPGSDTSSPHFGEKYKVIRGGCFDMYPQFNRTTFRGINLPTGHTEMIGFRCAMSAK